MTDTTHQQSGPVFPKEFLDEIRNRVSVSSVVSRSVKLIKRGQEFTGLSPFSAEKTPSFTVNDEKGFYHCFSTQEHGDIFTFLMKTRNMTFPEAVTELADAANLEMPARSAADRQKTARAKLLEGVVEQAAAFYEAALWGKPGAQALEYLRDRGLEDDTIKRFRLGYAPAGNALKQHLAVKGIGTYEMLEAKLLSPGKDDREDFDFFRERVMFPIMDVRGRVVAFGGRVLPARDGAQNQKGPAEGQPKYLNSGDTPLFHKGKLLYGLSLARESAARLREIIVVEGYMDVIALAQAGVENVVAPLGTALTEAQLALLWRYSEDPVLCFDGDKAGRAAAIRASDRALPVLVPGKSLRFVTLPEGLDPADIAQDKSIDGVRDALRTFVHLSEFVWAELLATHPANTPERAAGLQLAARAKAGEIKDESVRKQYMRFFAGKLAAIFEGDVTSADIDAEDGEDFDDIAEPPRTKSADILGDQCPILALGHHKRDDVQAYHIADAKGQLRSLTEKTFTITTVMSLFFGDQTWLKDFAPADKSDRIPWNMNVVQSALMRACAAEGYFVPDVSVRGPGVWPYGALKEWPRQDDRVVVHTGDKIVIWGKRPGNERDDESWGELGRAVPAGQKLGDYFYVAASPEAAIDGAALTDDEAQRIVDHLARWNWTEKSRIGNVGVAPLMVLGWFAAAFIAPLLEFRPSLFLRAPSTYGKSTAMMLGEGLLGSTALSVKRASMTGLRNEFRKVATNPARACFIDELEKKGEGAAVANRLQELYDLARYVYEQDRSNQLMGDGGASGRINTILMFSGINPPRLEREDANRMLLLTLGPPKVDAVSGQTFRDAQAAAMALGPKFRRRALERWSDYAPAYESFRLQVAKLGYAPRVNDTFGTILAAAWIMLRAGLPTNEQAYDWAVELSTSLLAKAIDETSQGYERCFNALMTTRVEVAQGKPRMEVREAARRLFDGSDGSWWAWALKGFGLAKVERVGHAEKRRAAEAGEEPKKQRWLAVAYEHQGLEEIFRGTDWRGGGWRTVLAQIPGAEDDHPVSFVENDQRGGTMNTRRKAVLIPETEVLEQRVEGDALSEITDPFALDDAMRGKVM